MDSVEFFNLIQVRNVAAVEKALESMPDLANTRDERNNAPLHWAVGSGNIKLVRVLLAKGADVNARNNDGKTPLFGAALNPDVMLLLMEAGADINTSDVFGETPLHKFSCYGKTQASELLINHGVDVHVTDNCGLTPLHHAAESGCIEQVSLLIANGVNINARGASGYTPLQWAVRACGDSMPRQRKWCLETIEHLIKLGADVTAQTSDGKTLLELAEKEAKFPEIIEMLKRYEAR
jgi:uncharacterized protein